MIWNKNDFVIQPWEKISFDISEKIHYSPENNDIELKFGDLFIIHKPLEWMDYGLGYRISYSKDNGEWLQENRTMLVVNFKRQNHKMFFKFSNRFEYRAFKVEPNHFRYKQQLTLTFPALTSWGMQFYTSEETYTKFNAERTHLARLTGGVSGIQKKHFQLKLYCALEKYKISENWNTSDILGINMNFIL